MTNKLRFGMDLDGVVADFNTSFLAYANKELRMNVKKTPAYSYAEVFNVLDVVMKNIIDRFIDEDNLAFLPTYKGYKTLLQNLEGKVDLFYVTSRPDNQGLNTYEWLKNNDIPFFNGVIFEKKKYDVARELELNVFVDDNPQFLFELLNTVKKKFMPHRSWNVGCPNERYQIQRVYNPRTILNYVREEQRKK